MSRILLIKELYDIQRRSIGIGRSRSFALYKFATFRYQSYDQDRHFCHRSRRVPNDFASVLAAFWIITDPYRYPWYSKISIRTLGLCVHYLELHRRTVEDMLGSSYNANPSLSVKPISIIASGISEKLCAEHSIWFHSATQIYSFP